MSHFEAWIGKCLIVGHRDADDTSPSDKECYAAVWTNSREGFETALRQHLKPDAQTLLWAEDVSPVTQWLQRNLHNQTVIKLARAVRPGNPVELSHLVVLNNNAADTPPSYLTIEELNGIEPLNSQFGVHPKLTVPEALRDLMFGDDVEPDEATLPLRTYAILDGAKMPYLLTGLMEGSGLRVQSLFQGETAEELREHSPYLVELTEDSTFTAKLMTGAEGVNGLWEKELGTYIRSRATFDDIRKHFRKFTRIQDEAGKWYYFAFWNGEALRYYLTGIENSAQRVSQFFCGRLASPVDCILAPDVAENRVHILRSEANENTTLKTLSPMTGDGEALALDPKYTQRFLSKSVAFLQKEAPEITDPHSAAEMLHTARSHIVDFRVFGLTTVPATACALGLILTSGKTLTSLSEREQAFLMQGDGSQYKRYRNLLNHMTLKAA